MSGGLDVESLDRELESFAQRVAALQSARAQHPDEALAHLDAALVELALAEDRLHACRDHLAAPTTDLTEPRGAAQRERRVLRGTFQELPVPALLLDHTGAVRLANRSAGDFLATTPAFLNGKPLSAFVHASARAPFRKQLAAVDRDGRDATFDTTLVRRGRPQQATITLSRVEPRGEPRPVILAVLPAPDVASGDHQAPIEAPAEEELAVAAAGRLELMSAMTRLLLDQRSLHEAVAQQRAVRLLVKESADWAVIDVVRGDEMHRAAVAGSDRSEGIAGVRLLEQVDPDKADLPWEILQTGNPVIRTVLEDEQELGSTGDGAAVLPLLRAVSFLCLPLRDGHGMLGALTLVRGEGRPGFSLSDLGVMEEIGEHLALALRAERSYQRWADVADAMQASLLPKKLPTMAGFDLATGYRAATQGTEVGGDFYDVFHAGGGLRCVLGDVCGKGEEAAAATAIVRHGVRTISTWERDPAQVLRQVNQVMAVHGETSRFVTAVVADLMRTETGARVRLASAGHPRAIVARADGTVHSANGGGLPLGVFDDVRPHTEELELGVGDLLLLYSDGVTDARTDRGPLFGDDGLVESLARCHGQPAGAVLKAVEDDIHAHAKGWSHDDVALLAVRVEPDVAPSGR